MADRHERRKGIAFAGAVGFRLQECLEKLGSIWDERLRVLEDRRNGPNGVLAHIGMAVFQARAGRGKEGLDKFGLAQLAQETESIASDIFVRVLKIVTNAIAIESKLVSLQ